MIVPLYLNELTQIKHASEKLFPGCNTHDCIVFGLSMHIEEFNVILDKRIEYLFNLSWVWKESFDNNFTAEYFREQLYALGISRLIFDWILLDLVIDAWFHHLLYYAPQHSDS